MSGLLAPARLAADTVRMRRSNWAGLVVAALAASAACGREARADEGQWAPHQIAELDAAELRARGLALSPSAIHDEHGGGLLSAVLYYSGCTASFISATGLIATNHHCAYGDLQSQSTPEHDYLTDGFLANDRAQELRTRSRGTMEVLDRTEDVTAKVVAAMKAVADDRARHHAIEKISKELVAGCETEPHHRCRIASFYEGTSYRLYRYTELRDVRIVYAPPAAIGEYGGDVDNWMWPRHTGDFTILRAYVGPDGTPADYSEENEPYRPARHLKVSPNGVKSGDFVMIMGYPGSTNRHLPAVEVARYVEQVLPSRASLYGSWMRLLEAEAQRSKAVAIKVAATRKSLANREKNARGMLEGIKRMNLLPRRQARDERLTTIGATDATHKGTMAEVAKLSKRRLDAYPRSFLLDSIRRAPNLLPLATDLVRRARERQKPDLERATRFMDRNERKLNKGIARRLRNFDAAVEAKLITSLLGLSQGVAIPALDALREAGGDNLLGYVREQVDASELNDKAKVDVLFVADVATLEASDDPLLKLALALVPTLEADEAEDEAIEGAAALVGPKWFRLLKAEHTGPLYPDANRTLRFSYASVEGYEPRDGLYAFPHTTLHGAVAKHTGREPFDLPERVRNAAEEGRHSFWAPPALGDVPICFLANGDTTGGNSGSPVVNGRGELVGLNFDRVWENIAGDFGYNPPLSRNVIVDARYILFLMDRVDGAGALLEELGLGDYRGRQAPSSWEPELRPPATNPVGCHASGDPSPSGWSWVLMGLALTCLRRRHGTVS
jgi:Peptidase S46